MGVRGIIFDLDGVLIDTERISSEAWTRAGEEFGYDLRREYPRLVGLTDEKCLEILRDIFGDAFPEQPFLQRAHALFDQRVAQGVPVKPGALELLDFIQTKRIRRAIATSAYKESAARKLRAAGLHDQFDIVITRADVKNHKPAPDVFLAAASAMMLPPQQCLVLEDSPSGILAAEAAGMIPVLVPDVVQPNEDIRRRSRAVLVNLVEAQQLIRSLLDY
jgi:HAD superfamily hydrolase (TIGR01509 family)